MNILSTLALLAVSLSLPMVTAEGSCKSIVDIALGDDNFDILVEALGAADLVDTLDGDGPFTVFAPTDAAFEDLGSDVLDDLLEPENKEALTDILLYHVVSGMIFQRTLKMETKVETLQGSKVTVKTDPVRINDSKVIKADIKACNGVIHVIDEVLIPPTSESTSSKPSIKNVGECSSSHPCGMCEGT